MFLKKVDLLETILQTGGVDQPVHQESMPR
jgi:hypothetical protein